MEQFIYLDYAATTPLDPRVEAVMRPFGCSYFGNPSSPHAAGRRARTAVDEAREAIADRLWAQPAELIFTSGGTEANNLALFGVARALRARGTHIITTAFEHHAVLEPCRILEREGFQVTYLQPDPQGFISSEQLAEAMTPETVLVSVMMANNEIGTLQPIAAIGELCRARGILFHTDAVQAAGELSLNVRELQVDLLSISGHKCYGPKGVGALYVRAGTRLQPLLFGGGQEHERRAGTEHVAGIVGLAAALHYVDEDDQNEYIATLRDQLLEGLLVVEGARLHGSRTPRLANNLNIAFAGVSAEMLVMALDFAGIAVSAGAACSAGAAEPSHVIRALGYDRIQAQEAVRFSLGRDTTADEVTQVIAVLQQLVPRLRGERVPC